MVFTSQLNTVFRCDSSFCWQLTSVLMQGLFASAIRWPSNCCLLSCFLSPLCNLLITEFLCFWISTSNGFSTSFHQIPSFLVIVFAFRQLLWKLKLFCQFCEKLNCRQKRFRFFWVFSDDRFSHASTFHSGFCRTASFDTRCSFHTVPFGHFLSYDRLSGDGRLALIWFLLSLFQMILLFSECSSFHVS